MRNVNLINLIFSVIQSGQKNHINKDSDLQTGRWAVKKDNIWSEKVRYTICKESQELLSSITAHSILGDSEAKNRSQEKWMTSLSHLLFLMADGRFGAERGLTGA